MEPDLAGEPEVRRVGAQVVEVHEQAGALALEEVAVVLRIGRVEPCDELGRERRHELAQELLARPEVVVQAADRDAGAGRDGGERRVVNPGVGRFLERRREDARARLLRLGVARAPRARPGPSARVRRRHRFES
ncbi:MAG TPA: hypothetical protein VFD92_21745 [Candidatus Binatia bacterium]|nr:hypothetical protein [Candidatus Binatia bacterium]